MQKKGKGTRLSGRDLFAAPPVHTVFDDVYLILRFLKECGMIPILKESFSPGRDYQKVLCHLLHTICQNGSKIPCDDFIRRSFATCVLNDVPAGSLGSDTPYFTMMSDGKACKI